MGWCPPPAQTVDAWGPRRSTNLRTKRWLNTHQPTSDDPRRGIYPRRVVFAPHSLSFNKLGVFGLQ